MDPATIAVLVAALKGIVELSLYIPKIAAILQKDSALTDEQRAELIGLLNQVDSAWGALKPKG